MFLGIRGTERSGFEGFGPIPNQRNLWQNFQSPLMFDVVAISTYLTVSSLFWYTGLLPDLAVVRDRATGFRKKVFTVLSLGWTGRCDLVRTSGPIRPVDDLIADFA